MRLVAAALTCLAVFLLAAFPAWAGDAAFPDYLEADGAEVTPDGIVTASSNIALHVRSIIEGGEIIVTADEVVYDTNDGSAQLNGNVHVSVVGTGLELSCDHFFYDPLMEQMEVEGLNVSLPIGALVDKNRLPDLESLELKETHYYNITPNTVYIASGKLRLETSPLHPAFVLQDVRLSHHPDPDPDLFLHAEEIQLIDENTVVVKDLELRASGMEILSWPRLSRGLDPEPKMFSADFPTFRINRDIGASWKQGLKLDLRELKADTLLDLSPDYGALVYSYAYTNPTKGLTAGIAFGTKTVVDIHRRTIERQDLGTAVFSQRIDKPFPGLSKVRIDAEYGKIKATTREDPEAGIFAVQEKDTRLFTGVNMEFDPRRLYKDVYLVTGGLFQYIDYEDNGEDMRVIGGRAGVVWRQNGFDHYVLYRARQVDGTAVFAFDEVRRQEMDMTTSFHIDPQWRHVVHFVFDLEKDEFDKLQVGAMKKQKTYEVGLYWDFARENAGLEFGLLMP